MEVSAKQVFVGEMDFSIGNNKNLGRRNESETSLDFRGIFLVWLFDFQVLFWLRRRPEGTQSRAALHLLQQDANNVVCPLPAEMWDPGLRAGLPEPVPVLSRDRLCSKQSSLALWAATHNEFDLPTYFPLVPPCPHL